MGSRRKAIRKKVAELLKGKTLAGDKVFSNMTTAQWNEDLPEIVIYTRSETVEETSTAPREYKRTLELGIEITASGSQTPETESLAEDIVDDIAEQVETELNRDETLDEIDNALGKKVALVDALILDVLGFEFRGEGAKPTAACVMIFRVMYHEMRPGSIDDQPGVGTLKTVHAEWKVGHHKSEPDNVVEATDDITIPD